MDQFSLRMRIYKSIDDDVVVQLLSHVWLFVTSWTIAQQAPLSVGFPGKNTGVGCHFLVQGIFPTQGLNLDLLHCIALQRQILYH